MNRSSTRALFRVAGRTITRNRWRSALIVVLVGLPVAGMVAATTIIKTVTPTAERIATHQMGRADLIVYAGPGGTGASLRAHLPAGSTVEPAFGIQATLVVPGLRVPVDALSHDPARLGAGMLNLVSGRYPTGKAEADVSAEVARLAKVDVGGQIELAEFGKVTVVGVVEDQLALTTRTVFLGPDPAKAAEAQGQANWLVKLPAGVDPATLDLGGPVEVQGQAYPSSAEPPAFIVTLRSSVLDQSSSVGPATIVLGGLALVDAALVAAAAFAVAVRRRQRELGLLAATGARPRQLATTVLAEALLLGGIGAVAGVVLGLAGSLVASPFLDGLTGHRNPVVSPDFVILGIAAVMGLIAVLVAALVPAWNVSRMPVLPALEGRRPAPGSGRKGLALGAVLIVASVSATIAGAALRVSYSAQTLSTLVLLAAAVLGTLGFGAVSPWLLGQLERPSLRLPLVPRIALRDLARARSRSGPLVTALLAAFAASVALSAYEASVVASNLAHWHPPLFGDQIMFAGPGYAQAGPQTAQSLGAIASGQVVGVTGDNVAVAAGPAGSSDPNDQFVIEHIAVADPTLVKALGVEQAAPDLAAGRIVFLVQEGSPITHATVQLLSMTDGSVVKSIDIPASLLVTGLQMDDMPSAILSPASAAGLGLRAADQPGPDRFVIRLDHPVTDADLAKAAEIAAAYPETTAFAARPPDQGEALFHIALIAASIVFALSVTAVAVALGESESRPDQKTLLAIGADPRVRRRIAAARAGVIAITGGLLAVPAGLLPVWGLLLSRQAPLVVPVAEIAVALAVLPLVATLGTWLLSRPIPDWSAFRGAGT